MPVSEVAGPEGTVVTLFVLEFLCLNGLGAGFGAFSIWRPKVTASAFSRPASVGRGRWLTAVPCVPGSNDSSATAELLLRSHNRNDCLLLSHRPTSVECGGSLSTSEVKRHRAQLVLGWGTAWEDLRVLSAFHFQFCSCSPDKAPSFER